MVMATMPLPTGRQAYHLLRLAVRPEVLEG